jgi:hypothetical protein
MENSKAYNILKTLKPGDLIGFSKFLDSPYFNESKNVKKLFEIIRQYYPEFSSPRLNSTELHSRIYKTKELHFGNSVNNLFTKLIKLAELFLSIDSVIKDKLDLDKNLLKYYLTNNSRSQFEHKFTKVMKDISDNNIRDTRSYLSGYLIQNMELEYLVLDVYSAKKLILPTIISSNSKSLSVYYYISICRDYLRFLSFGTVSGSNPEIMKDKDYYEKIVNNIPDEIVNDLLELYKQFISIFTNQVKPDFIELRSKLLPGNLSMLNDDRVFLMKILFQYGKILFDTGNQSVGKEVMAFLKEIASRKLWLNPYGMLSEHAFNFITRFAVEINEFEWAEKFIFEYSELIDSDEKENILYYNLAVFFFYKTRSQKPLFNEDYEVALSYLSKVSSRYPLKKLSIYRLMMMIYIETNQTEYYYYQFDSMIHYLKEHKNSLNEKLFAYNMNFAKITFNICKAKESENTEKIKNIYSEITLNNEIEEIKWILETIQNLKIKNPAK